MISFRENVHPTVPYRGHLHVHLRFIQTRAGRRSSSIIAADGIQPQRQIPSPVPARCGTAVPSELQREGLAAYTRTTS